MALKCKLDGCNSTAVNRLVKGYCMMHYTRLRTTGALGPAVKFKDANGTCVVPECNTHAGPTGACRAHWHKINNPLKSRKRGLKSKGLTLESYNSLLEAQNGGCGVCGSKSAGFNRKNFAIDHDHSCCDGQVTCGKCIRGLLCIRCNLVLGAVEDSTELLQQMINYLAPTPLDRPFTLTN